MSDVQLIGGPLDGKRVPFENQLWLSVGDGRREGRYRLEERGGWYVYVWDRWLNTEIQRPTG